MGRNKVNQPGKLPYKLKQIRIKLRITQTETYVLINPDKAHLAKRNRAHISAYEKGKRTPSLLELLAYVKVLKDKTGIEVSTDVLIDDKRKLPF